MSYKVSCVRCLCGMNIHVTNIDVAEGQTSVVGFVAFVARSLRRIGLVKDSRAQGLNRRTNICRGFCRICSAKLPTDCFVRRTHVCCGLRRICSAKLTTDWSGQLRQKCIPNIRKYRNMFGNIL